MTRDWRRGLGVVAVLVPRIALVPPLAAAPGQDAAPGHHRAQRRDERQLRRRRARRGATPTCRAPGRATTCAACRRVRPQQFGDRLYLTDQEFADRSKRDEQARQRADNDVGSFRNDVGTRTWRQTSLIVDPADGRYPAFTPVRRDAARLARSRHLRRRAVRRPSRTSRSTTAASPAASSAGCCRCPTATATPSCRRRAWSSSATRWCTTRASSTPTAARTSAAACASISATRAAAGRATRWWSRRPTSPTRRASAPNGNGLRHSADLKMTERITRVAEDVVQYEVTVNDPKTYVAPFTISMPLTPLRGEMLLPYECHEGNYGLKNALSAERAEDKAIADDLAKGITRPRRAGSGHRAQPPRGAAGRGELTDWRLRPQALGLAVIGRRRGRARTQGGRHERSTDRHRSAPRHRARAHGRDGLDAAARRRRRS